MAETTVWVELEPVWSTHRADADGQSMLDGIKHGRVWKNRPTVPVRGAVVKLRLCVPDAVFGSLLPPVTVEIPESAVVLPVVTVEAAPDGEG